MCFRSFIFYALVLMCRELLLHSEYFRHIIFLEGRVILMEIMFILAGVISFLTSLRCVLNVRVYSHLITIISGVSALAAAAFAYDMYSPVLLAVSLCLTMFSWLCMSRDRQEYMKRIKKYTRRMAIYQIERTDC